MQEFYLTISRAACIFFPFFLPQNYFLEEYFILFIYLFNAMMHSIIIIIISLLMKHSLYYFRPKKKHKNLTQESILFITFSANKVGSCFV
jgi:hypothetical protein